VAQSGLKSVAQDLRGVYPGVIYAPKVATGVRPGFQPGFNPGNLKINEFALTRHMNVRSMNNTRSSGLEMLKGREADRINLASGRALRAE
jgi:hypothetical protein